MAEVEETVEAPVETGVTPEDAAGIGVPDSPEPEAPAPEEPTEEASPPDVGESIAQMREQMEQMEQMASRLPEPEEEPETDLYGALTGEYEEEGEPADPDQPGQLTPEQEVEQEIQALVDQRIQEQVGPIFAQQEEQRRAAAINALADEHPRLREPEVIDAVDQRLEGMAQRYGNPHLRTDPEFVEMAYKAYEADAAASGEAPAEAGGSGTNVEKGAGPGAPDPEVDPVTQSWLNAARGQVEKDPLVG